MNPKPDIHQVDYFKTDLLMHIRHLLLHIEKTTNLVQKRQHKIFIDPGDIQNWNDSLKPKKVILFSEILSILKNDLQSIEKELIHFKPQNYLQYLNQKHQMELSYKAAIQYCAFIDFLLYRHKNKAHYNKINQIIEKRQANYLKLPALAKNHRNLYTDTILFNCGIAAFSTLIDYLLFQFSNRKSFGKKPLILTRCSYNENEFTIQKAFRKENILIISPDAEKKILKAIYEKQAFALFCECITNHTELIKIPILTIMEALRKKPLQSELFIVLDITASGCMVDIEKMLLPRLPKNIIFVIVESLQKFYQRGLELTSGGIIHLIASQKAKLNDLSTFIRKLRALSATSLEPYNAFKLNLLDITYEELSEKARIHWSNTITLAQFVKNINSNYIKKVSFPVYTEKDRTISQCAPYFWLILKENHFHNARLLIYSILYFSSRYFVRIHYRDSFYFNETALHMSKNYYQGVRVSSGMHSGDELSRLKLAFEEAVHLADQLSKNDGLRFISQIDDQKLKEHIKINAEKDHIKGVNFWHEFN